MKENGFIQEKTRSRRYPAQLITDAVNADDIAFLANTSTQAEVLLHNLEQAACGIGFHVNANKTEYMRSLQRGVISTLNGDFLKLVDKFPYLESSIASTENVINTRLVKAWSAINWFIGHIEVRSIR